MTTAGLRLAVGSSLLGLMMAGVAVATTVAPAPRPQTRIDLFERRLEFALPDNFVWVTDKRNGTNVLIEYVPGGEGTANWTRMVTIQAYRGLGRSPQPTSAIARQAFYPAACKIGPIYRDFGEQALDPVLTQTIIANGCASLPAGAYPKALTGAGEQDFIIIFRDAETIYTLNYAERGAPFAGKAPPRDVGKATDLLASKFGRFGLYPSR